MARLQANGPKNIIAGILARFPLLALPVIAWSVAGVIENLNGFGKLYAHLLSFGAPRASLIGFSVSALRLLHEALAWWNINALDPVYGAFQSWSHIPIPEWSRPAVTAVTISFVHGAFAGNWYKKQRGDRLRALNKVASELKEAGAKEREDLEALTSTTAEMMAQMIPLEAELSALSERLDEAWKVLVQLRDTLSTEARQFLEQYEKWSDTHEHDVELQAIFDALPQHARDELIRLGEAENRYASLNKERSRLAQKLLDLLKKHKPSVKRLPKAVDKFHGKRRLAIAATQRAIERALYALRYVRAGLVEAGMMAILVFVLYVVDYCFNVAVL